MEDNNKVNLFSQKTLSTVNVFGSSGRLNDYDLNILNNRSYLDIDDETIKLEYSIAEKEDALDTIRVKIKGAELGGKLPEVIDLKIQEKQLVKDLEILKEQFSKRSLSEKVADSFTGAITKPKNTKVPPLVRLQKFLTRKLLPKISRKFREMNTLSESLERLSSINNNVDELMAMKIPYGETAANYEKLTAYLYKAGKIHSEINKKMNNII